MHFATQNICKWLKKSPDSTIIYLCVLYVHSVREKKKSICNNAKRIESGTAAEYNKKEYGKAPTGNTRFVNFSPLGYITTFQRTSIWCALERYYSTFTCRDTGRIEHLFNVEFYALCHTVSNYTWRFFLPTSYRDYSYVHISHITFRLYTMYVYYAPCCFILCTENVPWVQWKVRCTRITLSSSPVRSYYLNTYIGAVL